MNSRMYIIDLYDIYSELLNDKQKEYFEHYYYNNLSLGEIADILKVSRNAVHKNIKAVEMKLKEYESKLNLYEKNKKIKKIITKIEDKDIKIELENISW